VIFIALAFYGVMPVWVLIKGQYVVKMAITIGSLPMIYLVRSKGQGPRFRTAEESLKSLG
jgi:uncharacterized PurR-regulated membrane protein YhhQ (DUF165 family)